jgi:hypothetical protein
MTIQINKQQLSVINKAMRPFLGKNVIIYLNENELIIESSIPTSILLKILLKETENSELHDYITFELGVFVEILGFSNNDIMIHEDKSKKHGLIIISGSKKLEISSFKKSQNHRFVPLSNEYEEFIIVNEIQSGLRLHKILTGQITIEPLKGIYYHNNILYTTNSYFIFKSNIIKHIKQTMFIPVFILDFISQDVATFYTSSNLKMVKISSSTGTQNTKVQLYVNYDLLFDFPEKVIEFLGNCSVEVDEQKNDIIKLQFLRSELINSIDVNTIKSYAPKKITIELSSDGNNEYYITIYFDSTYSKFSCNIKNIIMSGNRDKFTINLPPDEFSRMIAVSSYFEEIEMSIFSDPSSDRRRVMFSFGDHQFFVGELSGD